MSSANLDKVLARTEEKYVCLQFWFPCCLKTFLTYVICILSFRIKEGDYYEAHQATRTVVNRYVRTKKYDDACQFLSKVAELLARAGESSSASDLILYLIEVYKKAKYPVSPENRGQLVQLVSYLDAGKEPLVKKIAKEALEWSQNAENAPFGDPELQHVFGVKFAQQSTDSYEAERHLLLGTKDSPRVLAKLLYKWAVQPGSPTDKPKTSGLNTLTAGNAPNASKDNNAAEPVTLFEESPEERASNLPLYLSRGVFGYLTLGNIRDARAITHEFIQLALNDKSSYSLSQFLEYELNGDQQQSQQNGGAQIYVFDKIPLLNFIQLLIPTCQIKSAQMYQRLKSRYDEIIQEISAWTEALGVIGKLYFGIQPPRNQGNMLQDLFGSFMGGGLS